MLKRKGQRSFLKLKWAIGKQMTIFFIMCVGTPAKWDFWQNFLRATITPGS